MKSHVELMKTGTLAASRSASFGQAVHGFWQQVRRWHALYRQRRQLAALSDEMLKDLGLSRADIDTEAHRPFWDEPFRRG